MPKKIEDIVPAKRTPKDREPVNMENNLEINSERRSIRDIPIPESRRKSINMINPQPVAAPMRAAEPMPPPRNDFPPYKDFVTPARIKKSYSKRVLWLAIVVVIVAGAFGILSVFAGATLSYTPKTALLTFSGEAYSASKNADSASGQLLFSVIQLSDDKSTNVPASGSEQVSKKAGGTLIVYNNYSSAAQKFVKTTRFETTDGKVYRTPVDITVPGKSTVNGVSAPGSVEINVVADQPGSEYNIGLSDFTIPGLKGDPRYSTIYARSKTPMTGGFVGMAAKVSDADLASAESTLEAGLKGELVAKAQAQVPSDFILFPALATVTYQLLPQGTSTETTATVNERGNFSGVMFKKTDLAAYLRAQKLGAASSTPAAVTLSEYSLLNATFSSGTSQNLLQADTINFQLSGTATIKWQTDVAALAGDLAGKDKSEIDTVLKNYPSVNQASAVIRPFWKSSFPSDPAKIKIEENGQ